MVMRDKLNSTILPPDKKILPIRSRIPEKSCISPWFALLQIDNNERPGLPGSCIHAVTRTYGKHILVRVKI